MKGGEDLGDVGFGHTESSNASRYRWVPAVALFCGFAILASVVVGGNSAAVDRSERAFDATARTDAKVEAAAISDYFERARLVLLAAADNPAMRNLYDRPGGRGPNRDDDADRLHINRTLHTLDTIFDAQVSEACLIDTDGTELARVVSGATSPASDLSPDESKNFFFGHSAAITKGEVYQSVPYVSPDTNEWVVANATPIVDASGTQRAILHFEITVESLRRHLRVGSDAGLRALLVDRRTGGVLLDGTRAVEPSRTLGTRRSAFSVLRNATAPNGVGAIGSDRYAFARLHASRNNANDLIVVVVGRPVSVGLLTGVGPWQLLLVGGAATMLLACLVALSARRRQLTAAATTDALTGLPNRVLLADRVRRVTLTLERESGSYAMLLVDLDQFKAVNDTLGHPVGDRLLCDVGRRLVSATRAGDTVARFGGDEFVIFLPRADLKTATAVADRIMTDLKPVFILKDIPVSIEGSIGIAIGPEQGQDLQALLQNADIAMYQAKSQKLGWAVYSADTDPYRPELLALAAELELAVRSDQLVVYYQPKVATADGSVHGVEALVRWMHPARGLIPPNDFIPFAERTGLIAPLTLEVFRQVLDQCRVWTAEGLLIRVAVNLSARCLDRAFIDVLAAMIVDADVDPSLLDVELTETAVMTDPRRVGESLGRLRALGIAISIDDFGTGYSSLVNLKELPLDEIKIDGSFVRDMCTNDVDAFIVRSTIALGKSLGLSIVAEGVEDEATLTELRELGCTLVQGFHLCRPGPASQIADWVRARMPLEHGATAGR